MINAYMHPEIEFAINDLFRLVIVNQVTGGNTTSSKKYHEIALCTKSMVNFFIDMYLNCRLEIHIKEILYTYFLLESIEILTNLPIQYLLRFTIISLFFVLYLKRKEYFLSLYFNELFKSNQKWYLLYCNSILLMIKYSLYLGLLFKFYHLMTNHIIIFKTKPISVSHGMVSISFLLYIYVTLYMLRVLRGIAENNLHYFYNYKDVFLRKNVKLLRLR